MKRFLITIALTCALAASTFAGDIPSDGSASHAPTGTTEKIAEPTPGDIPSGGKASEISSDALSALLSVLSFLV